MGDRVRLFVTGIAAAPNNLPGLERGIRTDFR